VVSTHPCDPWCSLRGKGKGPKVIFNSDFPDGVRDEQGVVDPAASAAIDR
jgi:hypothetical protein